MDILIKHQTKDGEIHFSTVESWKPTEDEAMIEAIRDFKKTHTDVQTLKSGMSLSAQGATGINNPA